MMVPAADEESRTFAFERDFVASLRCIPLAVRLKLDLAGVKLSLEEWHALAPAERAELLGASCRRSGEEARSFARQVRALVLARTGCEPAPLPPADQDAPWQRADDVPAQVSERAAAEGLTLTVPMWAALSRLERFALVKLSRPRHRAESFLAAARELGLASVGPQPRHADRPDGPSR